MSSNKLMIWDQVCNTDPSATKQTKMGGRMVTSINTIWPIKKATEVFGPVGRGWGYEVVEERYDKGAPINKEGTDGVEVFYCDSLIHTVRIEFWYLMDGERFSFPQYGHTDYIYKSKWGASSDSEAPKKSLSDALKKAMSMLGFSADVYSGDFDDRNYVEAQKVVEAIDKAEKKDEEILSQQEKLKEYVLRNMESIDNALQPSEVNGIVMVAARHLKRQQTIQELANIAGRGLSSITHKGETKKSELAGVKK